MLLSKCISKWNYATCFLKLVVTIRNIITINKYSLKFILSYSSIHQTKLIVIIIYINFYIFITYFIIYSIITINLINILSKINNTLKYKFNTK